MPQIDAAKPATLHRRSSRAVFVLNKARSTRVSARSLSKSQIRAGNLLSIGGPGSGVCRAHIILREHLDEFLDGLAEAAEERRAKAQKKARLRKIYAK